IIHPVIYIPSGMDKDTYEYVTAHERAHLKRMDHLWKPLGFVLLAVYWFNPLCWMAYILLCRDIEAACDEKVISDKDRNYMAAYSQALLDCSLQRRTIAACPLAFGETDVRGRIKGILNYKKPAFWVVITSALICIAVGVCFVTDPEMRDVAAASSDADIPVVSISDEDMVTGVTEPESEQTYENPGSRYMYTGNTGPVADGVWIDFAIALKSDGTYTWYESPVSSYIGVGTYSVEDGVLVMRDDETVCTPRVNRFRISGDSLYYISEESDNFMMVQLSDGEEFVRDDITIPEYPADNVSENMLSHKPVDNMMITAGFDAASHRETDFAGPVGEPVYAVCDGSVIYTGYDEALGNYIVIVPSVTTPAIKITYSHLDSSDVNEGDTVKAGDVIGSIGNTGRSTGPHLGLEMKIDDVPVDIIPYLEEIGE
ncbi:MAG: peptidoglycan DD-metalloendopeptidase family protein, partial [Lachnospiraceae bacterium]|nr:peptidoglycan DD-metalloendopeptidase family protein [Lachnospiraceae bacterium]